MCMVSASFLQNQRTSAKGSQCENYLFPEWAQKHILYFVCVGDVHCNSHLILFYQVLLKTKCYCLHFHRWHFANVHTTLNVMVSASFLQNQRKSAKGSQCENYLFRKWAQKHILYFVYVGDVHCNSHFILFYQALLKTKCYHSHFHRWQFANVNTA